MADETKKEEHLDEENEGLQEALKTSEAGSMDAEEVLSESVEALFDYDGFQLFEDAIEGANSLNPERPARRNRFLSHPDKKSDRVALKRKMKLWLDVLSNNDTLEGIISEADEKAKKAEVLFSENLKKALDESRDMEVAYRSIGAFFANAGDKADRVYFLDASMEDIKNLDSSRAYKALKAEFEETYNTFDLENTIGVLNIPGFLGSRAVVSKYARLAYDYKALLVTDFENFDTYEDILEEFKAEKLSGTDKYLSNAMMCAVWVQGRPTLEEIGEEPLYVPPSSFLTGKLYAAHESDATSIAQPSAGEKYGELYDAQEVKLKLLKTETGELEELGLIPMVKIRGKVVPMSAKTLFNGDNDDLKQYSIVRIFDWSTKVLIDYLNRKTFELYSPANRTDIYKKLLSFLDGLVRANIIKKFSKPRIEVDPTDPTKVYVDVSVTPLYATRAFYISLVGEKDDATQTANWKEKE
jgi:hypothetical protein